MLSGIENCVALKPSEGTRAAFQPKGVLTVGVKDRRTEKGQQSSAKDWSETLALWPPKRSIWENEITSKHTSETVTLKQTTASLGTGTRCNSLKILWLGQRREPR